jgi:inhibitor of cysteine peptidase
LLGLVVVCAVGGAFALKLRNAEALSGKDGRVIDLVVGQSYTVVLDSNPSTGYTWKATYDGSKLELVGQEFTPASTALGAAGQEHIEFKALARGTSEVRFAYQRPWEGNAERVVTYQFIVK